MLLRDFEKCISHAIKKNPEAILICMETAKMIRRSHKFELCKPITEPDYI